MDTNPEDLRRDMLQALRDGDAAALARCMELHVQAAAVGPLVLRRIIPATAVLLGITEDEVHTRLARMVLQLALDGKLHSAGYQSNLESSIFTDAAA